MSNYDEMAGRIMAHAFYDEMEKISGIGDMIGSAVGEFGKSTLRAAADKVVGKGAREAAERGYSSAVKHVDAMAPAVRGIGRTTENVAALGKGGREAVYRGGADIAGRLQRVSGRPGTATEKLRGVREVMENLPEGTRTQRAGMLANAMRRMTTKPKPPKNKGRRK